MDKEGIENTKPATYARYSCCSVIHNKCSKTPILSLCKYKILLSTEQKISEYIYIVELLLVQLCVFDLNKSVKVLRVLEH